jgi:hypothetical protein
MTGIQEVGVSLVARKDRFVSETRGGKVWAKSRKVTS